MKLVSRLKRGVASRVRKAWRRLKSHRKSRPPRFSIDELDTWSVLDIFDRLPLRDLIRVRLACREWDHLSRRACCGRRSLTLMMHPDAMTNGLFSVLNTPNDVLVTSQLDHATVEYLASTFPNIACLEVIGIS